MGKESPKGRITQTISRPAVNETVVISTPLSIMKMIDNGEEPKRIYNAICKAVLYQKGVTGSAIFLPSEKQERQYECVALSGDLPPTVYDEVEKNSKGKDTTLKNLTTNITVGACGKFNFFDIVCLGAPIGVLVVALSDELATYQKEEIAALAHHCAVVFERQKLSNTLQHFLDRLEVLNELNQLIASNIGIKRLFKNIARESAFRFAADVALTFLLNSDNNKLLVQGGYGCTSDMVPVEVELEKGILSQVMRIGSHISVANLDERSDHKLEFLQTLGVKSVDACCLEVRGESLGALLIGYKREYVLSKNDLLRFEEFAQGSAVAIANALNHQRIKAYTERLEELVEQRTADLAVQTARAEEANRAKSRFLANMSHELRTPLTSIVGYASVLADGLFGELNEKQADALSAIVRSGDHLKSLIDDVLNLARIESGKEQAEPRAINVSDIITQAYKLILQTAMSKGVEITFLGGSKEEDDLLIYADQKHMHQIIINLLSNAVKYTPKGGKVWITVEKIVDKVKISVSDTGVGIPQSKIDRLFDRFERGDDDYSRSQLGTGIGLNLTKKLVELNGGRIGVESQEGKGSVFWIMMPLAEQKKIEELKHREMIEKKVKKERIDGLSILVVEDNKDTLNVIEHILKSSGAEVFSVNNVSDGISVITANEIDLIITDLALPKENGLDLIKTVRKAEGELGSIPIIVLSACAFENDIEEAKGAGANCFISKPFRPSDLIKNIRELTFQRAAAVLGP